MFIRGSYKKRMYQHACHACFDSDSSRGLRCSKMQMLNLHILCKTRQIFGTSTLTLQVTSHRWLVRCTFAFRPILVPRFIFARLFAEIMMK